MIDENELMRNEIETQKMIDLIHQKTRISIDPNDPMIALFLFHHRYLEDFYSGQSEVDNKNAQNVYNALSPLISELKSTASIIEEKHKQLKQDIETFKAFQKELLALIAARSEELAQTNVNKEIKQQISGSLNNVAISLKNLQNKNNYLLIGVFALQFITVIILLFMILK